MEEKSEDKGVLNLQLLDKEGGLVFGKDHVKRNSVNFASNISNYYQLEIMEINKIA